ncbi:extracellular solute-binding protein [Streptococcus suis]|uniref:extracellular solute-binding protein n=1 Tax=Streptococcus suis TaxID=1307 RepID=UPI001ABDD050|nr:extracellular solute-binding protein [Streptococcus suis]
MKHKLLKSVALLAASTAVLAACSSSSSSSDSSTEEAQTLTIYVDEGYKDYVEAAATTFEEENGVDVTVKTGDALTGLDNLSLDNQSGSAPDVMMAPYDRVGSLGAEGQLNEVTLAETSMVDETTTALVTNDGKVYGSPAVIETLVLYYNKDLIAEAPKTFAELETLAKDSKYAFEGESGKTTAFLADWTNFYYTYGLLAGYGGYVFGENGTDPSDIGLANEGAVQAIEYAKTWYEKWPQGLQDGTAANNLINTQFTEGKAAAIIEGPWKAASYKEAGVNYGVAMIPTLANGNAYEAFGGGKAWVIPAGSQNPEMAQKFVDYLTSTEQQQALYDATNEVPANTEAREYAVSKNDELTTAVIDQFANAQPMPNISEMSTVWEPAGNMLFEAASGAKDAKTAASDAVALIKDTIAQKYGE